MAATSPAHGVAWQLSPIIMCQFTLLHPFNADRFTPLTHADYRPLLATVGATGGSVAVGALLQDEPVGLALAGWRRARCAEIMSVYVAPAFRRRGIGRQLCRRLEHALGELGAQRALFHYFHSDCEAHQIDSWLGKCGWALPGEKVFCFAVRGSVLETAWLDHAVCPEPFEVTPWTTLSDDERRLLEFADENENWIRSGFEPLRYEQRLDASISQLLRHRGRVVGWINAAPRGANSFHYWNYFIRDEFRARSRLRALVALLAAAIRSQVRKIGRETTGVFEIADDNVAFRRFVERRMADHIVDKKELRRLTKKLAPPANRLAHPGNI
jgi:GNAT superfamily N-acetyltransferase